MPTVNVQEIVLLTMNYMNNGYDQERALQEVLKNQGLEGRLSEEEMKAIEKGLEDQETARQELKEEDPEAYQEEMAEEMDVRSAMKKASYDVDSTPEETESQSE